MTRLWDWIRSAPWTFGIGAVIFLAAVAGVVYAVIARPGDLTFLEVDGRQLRWDRTDLPLTCFHARNLPAEHLAAWEAARAEVRSGVGGDLVSKCLPWELADLPRRGPDGGVLLRLRTDEDKCGEAEVCVDAGERGGTTVHWRNLETGRLRAAAVLLDVDLRGDELRRAVLHELGHVLGLAHDRERSSIMFPTLTDRAADLSGRDLGALRDAYLAK